MSKRSKTLERSKRITRAIVGFIAQDMLWEKCTLFTMLGLKRVFSPVFQCFPFQIPYEGIIYCLLFGIQYIIDTPNSITDRQLPTNPRMRSEEFSCHVDLLRKNG